MVTKEELLRRATLARYPRREDADFESDPDHNPLVLAACETCRGHRVLCEEADGQAVTCPCPACDGSGVSAEVERYFANDNAAAMASVDEQGWTTCPGCSRRFATKDTRVWTGLRHVPCGQRIVLSQ